MAVVSLAIVLLVLMATCKSLGLKHSARIKHFRLFEALNQEVPVELPVGSAVERLMGGRHVLDLSFDELTEGLGGSGKAKLFWEALRSGTDPLTGTFAYLGGYISVMSLRYSTSSALHITIILIITDIFQPSNTAYSPFWRIYELESSWVAG